MRSLSSIYLLVLTLLALPASSAAASFTINGKVTDQLGSPVPNAIVDLMEDDKLIASTNSNDQGNYRLSVDLPGLVRLHVRANGFEAVSSKSFYLGNASSKTVDLTLTLGALAQSIVVTATGTGIPQAQAGPTVSIIDLAPFANKLDVQNALRLTPGFQFIQNGQRGGLADLFVRGGGSNANKVIIDGIPSNKIGGGFDFSNVSRAGFEKVEVYRGPNSILYGADALASVVDITTRQGETALPILEYAIDGGNFGTYRQEASMSGLFKRFDYFGAFESFHTRNSIPNDRYANNTLTGNFGYSLSRNTILRATVRRIVSSTGLPNGLDLYGIPDNQIQRESDSYFGVTLQNQTTARWSNLLRYGAIRLRGNVFEPYPAGIPYDPFATGSPSAYIGAPVSLHGANGYNVVGQALFQFPGTFPAQSFTQTNRDFVYAQSHYDLVPYLSALFGFRYEVERGNVISQPFGSVSATTRGNYTYTAQFSGSLANRLFYTAGTGVDNNAVFGLVATPRASLAYYLFRPQPDRLLSGTKLRASYGQGIKEPDIYEQTDSLFGLLGQLANGSQLIAQHSISPIGAERSRSFDFGIEQLALDSRIKLTATLFHNDFGNQIEFVNAQALPQVGVPLDIAGQLANTLGGAYINSLKYRAQGAELELETKAGRHWMARAGYTYLDAVIQKSFSSDALSPAINPLFPNVPIGAYSPLIGGRPFRQAPHTGFFALFYTRNRWNVNATGSLVGRRDDSTFLTDQDFGNTLLLPNRNLDKAYQNVGLGGAYRVSPLFELYANTENLLCQRYDEAFGFPSLPFNFRAGVRITIGGESWKRH